MQVGKCTAKRKLTIVDTIYADLLRCTTHCPLRQSSTITRLFTRPEEKTAWQPRDVISWCHFLSLSLFRWWRL